MLTRRAAGLAHFERLFTASADPWRTRTDRAEQVKRQAVLALLGARPLGRVLELGCGNGAGSPALARRALRLWACDGSRAATYHARIALCGVPGAVVRHLVLPGRFPADRFDAIVICELLYYLPDRTLRQLMAEIDRTLRPGGALLLCHHHCQFHDAAQRQAGLQDRFAALSAHGWRREAAQRTHRWEAALLRRGRG